MTDTVVTIWFSPTRNLKPNFLWLAPRRVRHTLSRSSHRSPCCPVRITPEKKRRAITKDPSFPYCRDRGGGNQVPVTVRRIRFRFVSATRTRTTYPSIRHSLGNRCVSARNPAVFRSDGSMLGDFFVARKTTRWEVYFLGWRE